MFNIHTYLLQMPTEYSIYTPTYCNCRQNIQYSLLPIANADRIFNIHSYLLQMPKEYSIYTPTYCNCRQNIQYTSTLLPFVISIRVATVTARPRHHKNLATPLHECINPGRQVARATEFFTVVHTICGSSVCNLLNVTLLVSKIYRWLLRGLEL